MSDGSKKSVKPRASTRTGSVRRRRDAEETRHAVLAAAVESILEIGYYETSSNEIARRAGVTWGTIQHQFGTRELLMLEVLNEHWATFQTEMAHATVEGDTLEARLACVLDILGRHYAVPMHLAHVQIVLDLTHAPSTTALTRAAVAEHGQRLLRAWQPLFAAALGEAASHPDLVRYAFETLRGYLTGRVIASRIATMNDDATSRRLLVEGVAAALRSESRRRGFVLE